jgi:hypothetical protein
MVSRGIVKGNVVVLEEGHTLSEGTQVEVVPMHESWRGSPAALLQVWGSDAPDAIWEVVEKAIEALDRTDREYTRKPPYA